MQCLFLDTHLRNAGNVCCDPAVHVDADCDLHMLIGIGVPIQQGASINVLYAACLVPKRYRFVLKVAVGQGKHHAVTWWLSTVLQRRPA